MSRSTSCRTHLRVWGTATKPYDSGPANQRPVVTRFPRARRTGNTPPLDVLNHTFGQAKSYIWRMFHPSSSFSLYGVYGSTTNRRKRIVQPHKKWKLPRERNEYGRSVATSSYEKRTAMTAKERTLWEQAVRVLRQNTVTTKAPAARRAPAGLVHGLHRRERGGA